MSNTSWDKRGKGRFEVRVQTPATPGPATRSTYTRTSKLEIGLMALGELARTWANAHGNVKPGTVVDLVDTTDGGPVAQLKFLGFETGTLDSALNALHTNGFPQAEEIFPPGRSLAGDAHRR